MDEIKSKGPSGLSIAALVTGILGMAIVPLILGAIDLNRIKKGFSSPAGRGMSIAGLVLGIIETIGWIIYIIIAVVLIASFTKSGL